MSTSSACIFGGGTAPGCRNVACDWLPIRPRDGQARSHRATDRALHAGPPTIRNAAGVIVTATAAVVVAAGILISLVDSEEYPNVGLGIWWALQTITTVGYGNVTPTEVGGRLVAAVVMLQGVAFVAIITAVITSTFIARATREYEETRAKDELSDRELIEKRFDELERNVDLLLSAPDR